MSISTTCASHIVTAPPTMCPDVIIAISFGVAIANLLRTAVAVICTGDRLVKGAPLRDKDTWTIVTTISIDAASCGGLLVAEPDGGSYNARAVDMTVIIVPARCGGPKAATALQYTRT